MMNKGNEKNQQFIKFLETNIRNKESSKEVIIKSLYQLGIELGKKMFLEKFKRESIIETPMGSSFTGISTITDFENVVISTKDDYFYFAKGVADAIGDPIMGYMDFNGVRGKEALSVPVRSIVLPDIKTGKPVGYVVIAKAVIATGCTAISLARKACEKYMPKGIIITSAFYCERGLSELRQAIPNSTIYVATEPDEIDNNGMLIPGVGNIDERMCS